MVERCDAINAPWSTRTTMPEHYDNVPFTSDQPSASTRLINRATKREITRCQTAQLTCSINQLTKHKITQMATANFIWASCSGVPGTSSVVLNHVRRGEGQDMSKKVSQKGSKGRSRVEEMRTLLAQINKKQNVDIQEQLDGYRDTVEHASAHERSSAHRATSLQDRSNITWVHSLSPFHDRQTDRVQQMSRRVAKNQREDCAKRCANNADRDTSWDFPAPLQRRT